MKLLANVAHAGPQIERLIGILKHRPSGAASVSLLKIQALRKVVIVNGLAKYEHAAVQVFVTLRVAMEDRGLHSRRTRLRQLTVRGRQIENRAIAIRHPTLPWLGANQAD